MCQPHLTFTGSAARAFSLDLTYCDALTQLDIVHMHLYCVIEFLYTVQHHSLQFLHVGCHRSDDAAWEALCTVLNRPCFSSLRTLTVSYFNLDSSSVANARRSVAPLLSKAVFRFFSHDRLWSSD
jgi:hypothetical protein